MQKYTEYNDDRVKQLMDLSKKRVPPHGRIHDIFNVC